MRIAEILFWNNEPTEKIVLTLNLVHLQPHLVTTRQILRPHSPEAA